MSKCKSLSEDISNWILNYANSNNISTLVVGVSGGIDSAVTSTLCAKTGLRTLVVNMPINQNDSQSSLSNQHMKWLVSMWDNVESHVIDLSETFDVLNNELSKKSVSDLAMANTRARIRMTALYSLAGSNNGIVVGTGNKVEDFGVGFYTKYGDGGVDISPIADCNKSEVWEIGKSINILQEIIEAAPTDGLWDDGRTDEGQLGLKYEELEEAMNNVNSINREKYEKIRKMNLHKMEPIPVCKIPN